MSRESARLIGGIKMDDLKRKLIADVFGLVRRTGIEKFTSFKNSACIRFTTRCTSSRWASVWRQKALKRKAKTKE